MLQAALNGADQCCPQEPANGALRFLLPELTAGHWALRQSLASSQLVGEVLSARNIVYLGGPCVGFLVSSMPRLSRM